MIKLYGFPLSNYFNMVKIALMEKGMEFEFVPCRPSQEEDLLCKTPMGKIPCIETEDGFLSETSAILDYIEDVGPAPAFYPKDAFQRAKVKELIREIELYIELPARTCYAEAFFGGKVSDETKEKALLNINRGIKCVRRMGSFSPYAMGSEPTYADFYLMFSLDLAGAVGKRVLDADILAEFPEAKPLLELMGERDCAKQIRADQQA